jgi:hypothetical protein
MVGKVLGAVGLGSVAGAGAARATSGQDESAVADSADQPTSTTGISSQTVPQQSGPPTGHHRKESIPTTAYPAGPDSPRPVAPPVGGTQPQEPRREQEESHRGRDATLGTAAAGVGAGAIGAGTYAAHEHGERKAVDDTTTGPSTATGAPVSHTEDKRTTAGEAEPIQPSTSTTYHDTVKAQPEQEDHTARNVAGAGAVGVGAGAAGAYAAHEDKDITMEGEKEKKPSIFKRLFKRTRKNKDTGEDEEYEEEGEEEHDSHKELQTAAGIGVVGTAVGGGVVYGSVEEHGKPISTAADPTGKPTTSTTEEAAKPTTTTSAPTAEETTKPIASTGATATTDPSDKSYEAQSGGVLKPSYSPLKKDDTAAANTAEHGRTGEKVPYETGTAASATERYTEPTSTTSTAATGAEQHTTSSTSPYAATAAETSASDKPIEPVTGLPYDPSKDPAAAKRIEERDHEAIRLMEEAKAEREKQGTTGEHVGGHGTHEHGTHHGEDKEGLGDKLKGMFHLGGGVKEDSEKLKEEGFEHRHEHQHPS